MLNRLISQLAPLSSRIARASSHDIGWQACPVVVSSPELPSSWHLPTANRAFSSSLMSTMYLPSLNGHLEATDSPSSSPVESIKSKETTARRQKLSLAGRWSKRFGCCAHLPLIWNFVPGGPATNFVSLFRLVERRKWWENRLIQRTWLTRSHLPPLQSCSRWMSRKLEFHWLVAKASFDCNLTSLASVDNCRCNSIAYNVFTNIRRLDTIWTVFDIVSPTR